MAAPHSSTTSESFSQAIPSGSSIAPRPRAVSISTSVSTAPSPPGPPTPSSSASASGSVYSIAIKPGKASKPAPITTSGPPANKMTMASVLSPGQSTQLSMTSKEWVIPPRPKPGRKPATDTPPTKRKAQNRAAQRAFRERRAARVGELEEELSELKEEHKKREEELEERIRHLETESETLRARCQWLQSSLEKERLDRTRQSVRTTQIQPQESGFGGLASDQTTSQGRGASQMVAPRPGTQPFSISHIISPPEQPDSSGDITCGSCAPGGPCVCVSTAIAETAVGCGKCTLDTRCACLEALEAETTDMSDLKRPLRPSSPSSTFAQPDEKRQRVDSTATTAMEIDFTTVFSQPKKRASTNQEATTQEVSSRIAMTTQPQPQDQPRVSVEIKDSCGFCSAGSYCVCADAHIEPTPAAMSLSSAALNVTASAPTHQQQTHTPPPSDDDVVSLTLPIPMEVTATGAIKLPPFNRQQPQPTNRSTCGPGGPGTCAQCIADPKSGLFCRSLAANFERSRASDGSSSAGGGGGGGGCCGGGSASGGCCKQQAPDKAGEKLGLSLSCADAYKTLASHSHFEEAAGEIGEWLPRLRAAPVHVAGRQPIEVEAASIMSVLRGFDVRFGSGL